MYNSYRKSDKMFENLSDRLQNAIKKIKGQGTITEENISDMMRIYKT